MNINSALIYSEKLPLDFLQIISRSHLALIPFYSDGRVGFGSLFASQ